jgi:hypothetical protein
MPSIDEANATHIFIIRHWSTNQMATAIHC